MSIAPHEYLPPGIPDNLFANTKQRSRCESMYLFMRRAGYAPHELLMRYYTTNLGLIHGVEVIPQSLHDYQSPSARTTPEREKTARYAAAPINGGP